MALNFDISTETTYGSSPCAGNRPTMFSLFCSVVFCSVVFCSVLVWLWLWLWFWFWSMTIPRETTRPRGRPYHRGVVVSRKMGNVVKRTDVVLAHASNDLSRCPPRTGGTLAGRYPHDLIPTPCAWRFFLAQALRKEEASESESMENFLRDLVRTTLTDKVNSALTEESRARKACVPLVIR